MRISANGSTNRDGIGVSSQTVQADRPNLLLVEPKLMLPRVQPGMVRRSRLLELLDGDGGAALTVVNAPVGYGKTTLMRSWCVERSEAVIWMTLDGADDDPVRLWAHLATAVERLGDGLGGRALMALGTRGAPVETAVDELMHGLVAYGRPVVIVLDDVHAVGGERSLRSIAHALERLPDNVVPGIKGEGVELCGTEGRLLIDRGHYEFRPIGKDAQPVIVKTDDPDMVFAHVSNFLECVRTRQRPDADVLIGHRSAQASHLGNISYMEKRRIDFDPQREEILPF